MKQDPRIDAYIGRQADFARPILAHLRAAVHAACPDTEETPKWGMPAFLYRGEQLAGMAAFKAHATFGFWRGSLVLGDDAKQRGAMGQFGRLTSIGDLPDTETLHALIRKAMTLTEQGVKPVRAQKPKGELVIPDELRDALAGSAVATATFEAFSPSAKRDYADWVAEAKRDETRRKRIAQAVQWIAEGKKRHWKYEKC